MRSMPAPIEIECKHDPLEHGRTHLQKESSSPSRLVDLRPSQALLHVAWYHLGRFNVLATVSCYALAIVGSTYAVRLRLRMSVKVRAVRQERQLAAQ